MATAVSRQAPSGTVKKSYEVIMARGKYQLELVDMKAFMYLLHRTYGLNQSTGTHRVPIKEVLNYVGHTSASSLETTLRRLGSVKIEIDYRENDEQHSVNCHFLSYDVSKTDDGILEFAFDPILMRFIFEPTIYGKISMRLFQQFKSVSGAKLYEIMALFQNRKYRSWSVSIEEFRERMGIAEHEYKRFDNLKRSVIDKAVNEVNRIAPFGVSAKYVRSGRGGRVVSIEFSVVPRTELSPTMTAEAGGKTSPSRDPNTVDMLDGHTDAERIEQLVISDNAISKASDFLGTDINMQKQIDDWRESIRNQGEPPEDPDMSFLQWIQMQDAQDISVLDEDVLENLLTQFE